MNQPNIVVIGNPTQDVFLTGPALAPGPDQTTINLALGEKFECQSIITVGGSAANVAVALARTGLRPRFVGRVGHDLAGRANHARLQTEQVEVEGLRLVEGGQTNYSVILLTSTGERTILAHHRQELDPADWEAPLAGLQAGDWLYLSSVGEADALAAIVKLVEGRGIRIGLNPSTRALRSPPILRSIAPQLELLIANREEMGRLWPGDSSVEIARQASPHVPVAVITDGPRGAVATHDGQLWQTGLYRPESPVVDRTGAGDAFAGGFLAGLIFGQPIETCLTWAAANSTAVVGRIGGQAGILSLGRQTLDPLEIRQFPIPSHSTSDQPNVN